jgi:putative heme-binding domain-containing protein
VAATRNALLTLTPVLLVLGCGGLVLAQTPAQQDHWEEDFKPDAVQGRQLFAAKCGSCHGMDGRGSERAPNIADNTKLRNLSDAAVSAIVSNGVPGTGMPAFRSLGPSEVRSIVSHLRVLQGKSSAQRLPGDSARGKGVFFGKGDCSSCHMVNGEGGFIGQDLSTYGSTLSAKEILQAITKPKEDGSSARAVEAITRDGQRVVGSIRNEDNFSVQLQTADGVFTSLLRSDLQSLAYQDHPIMPANYGERLTRKELDDLASYLISVGRTAKADRGSQPEN